MLRFASCHLPSEFQHRIRINTDTVLSFEYIQYIHKTKYFWGLLHFQVMQSILWFDALPVSGGAHNRCGVTPNRTGKQACKTCRCLQQSLLSAWATSIPIKISLLKIVWFSLPAPSFSGNKLSLKKKKKVSLISSALWCNFKQHCTGWQIPLKKFSSTFHSITARAHCCAAPTLLLLFFHANSALWILHNSEEKS